jgi:anti-sigma B factor antagonist
MYPTNDASTINEVEVLPAGSKEPKLKLSLESRTQNGITVIHCIGRITYREEASALSSKVAELLPHSRQIILDLSGVDVVDSAGLGELVVVLMSGQITGCPVKLAAPRKHVRALLELTNLASVFEIHSSLEDALAFPSHAAAGGRSFQTAC